MSRTCRAARPTSPTRRGWPSCSSAGCCAGSFVPPREIAQLRDLTRYRKKLVEERARETQRIQKVLEDAGIKLDSVVTDMLGVAAGGCSKR